MASAMLSEWVETNKRRYTRMELWASAQRSIKDLFRQLADAAKNAVKQEIELAKTEMGEKVSRYGRQSALAAAGGLFAYAGLLILLVGIGFVVAFGFRKLGLDDFMAAFVGLAIVGVISIGMGTIVLMISVKNMKALSLAPEKAVHAAKELKAEVTGTTASAHDETPSPSRSSSQLHSQVRHEGTRVGEALEQLKERLTIRSLSKDAFEQVKSHPVEAALVGAGAGLAGLLLVRQKRRHPNGRVESYEQAEVKGGLLGKALAAAKLLELGMRARAAFRQNRATR